MTYNATEKELADYGLDALELAVTVDYTRQEPKDGKDGEKEDFTAYIKIGDSQIVYEVGKADYLNIMRSSYDDFRHEKVFTGDLGDVTRIDIAMEDQNYVFTAEQKDEECVWRYQDRDVLLTDFKAALDGLSADSLTGEKPAEKKEISLTFYLDNENFPQVQVELHRYDGAYCLAVVGGESTSLIQRSAAVKLMEAVNAIVLSRETS